MNFDTMSLQELIRPEGFDCECGRHHVCALKFLSIGRNAIMGTAEMVRALGCAKPFIVCDANTCAVAGERVCTILRGAGIEHVCYVIPGERLSPAEWELGSALMHFDPSCDLVLGVGSGVINDICKVLAHALRLQCAIVGTAPSMDGWASNSSSMEVNHVKVTLYNHCPTGIILDTEILAQAPMRMLWAGFGDMVAKYVAICEWRISNLITGEYYCPGVAAMMRAAVARVVASAGGITSRDPDAIQSIAEGLLLAGIAMAYAGFSRPASGLEHYFSHMWEMMALERGQPYDLHGIQVGVGTILTLKLYRYIRVLVPERGRMEAHAASLDPVAWEARVRRIFGRTADNIIEIENSTHKNDPGRLQKRIDAICAHWGEICAIIDEELPDFERLHALMAATGMPLTPREIGISDEDVINAYLGARDIRDKYLSCSLMWDMGLEQEAAEYLRGCLI